MYAEDPADSALIDLNMPGVDGFEVIRQIGAHSPEIKIVVLSGASQETEQKASGMRTVRTLSKPVQGAELIEIVNDLMT